MFIEVVRVEFCFNTEYLDKMFWFSCSMAYTLSVVWLFVFVFKFVFVFVLGFELNIWLAGVLHGDWKYGFGIAHRSMLSAMVP